VKQPQRKKSPPGGEEKRLSGEKEKNVKSSKKS